MEKFSWFVVSLALAALLSGCALFGPRPDAPTVEQVIQMSQAQVPADTIIRQMRDSGAVYRLPAAELARLHQQGVEDRVINYMQSTYIDDVRRSYYPGYGYGPYGGMWGGRGRSGIGFGLGF